MAIITNYTLRQGKYFTIFILYLNKIIPKKFFYNIQPMKKIIYNRIKSVLAENGKSINELAVFLKLKVTTISNWCENESQPSLQNLDKIAFFLQIDIRELLVQTKWD